MLVVFATLTQQAAAQVTGTPAPPAASAAAPVADHRADEQAIRALSQQWLAAQRKKDLAGVMSNFSADAVAFYDGKLITGSEALSRHHQDGFASTVKGQADRVPSWETTSVDVAQAGDIAYESGTYDDSWNAGKSHERGHYLTVWRKVGAEWKVVRDFAAPDAMPAAGKSM